MKSWRLALAAAAAAALLAVPAVAAAGSSELATQNTSTDTTGWTGAAGPGFAVCDSTSDGGVCGSLPAIHPITIVGSGTPQPGSSGTWEWDVPGSLQVTSGALAVDWKLADPGTSVVVKVRSAGQTFGQVGVWRAATGSGSAHWAIPAGTAAIQVQMTSSSGVAYPATAINRVNISQLAVNVSDTTAPVVRASAQNGGVYPDTAKVCVDTAAADTGSGIRTVVLRSDTGVFLSSATVDPISVFQGRQSLIAPMCADPSLIGDGRHTLSVTATDLAGNTKTAPVTVTLVQP